ncbi:MAG: GNAT family N-acetyltransferase [Candidatus Nanopelagicales bacterium]|nr:GNAT family N-acetyltransferase [Candidatus Nanopelagicales bacterium]
MLQGETIRLRLVREDDLPALHAFEEDISNRGDFYPIGVSSLTRLQQRFAEDGLWSQTEGTLLIEGPDGQLLGHIEFFPTVAYLDEIELSYLIYEEASRGRGVTTEAVRLLAAYLFGRTKANRIRLVIHPDNAASRRVAAKCGFSLEGTARGAWYHRGRHHDVEVWSLLRDDHAHDAVP